MSIITRYRQWLQSPAPGTATRIDNGTGLELRDAIGASPIRTTIGKPLWPSTNPAAMDSEGYRKLALIYRCVGLTAQSIANAPLRVYDTEGEEVPEHPLRDLLYRPNQYSGESRFMAFASMSMSVAGFVVVEKERANSGQVIGLWPINPSWCRPIMRDQAAPDWEIRIPGHNPAFLGAEDVLALTYSDRIDGSPFGLGPLEVATREGATLNVMIDFVKAFFDAGAMPVYALIPREGAQLTQAEADTVREKWRAKYGGLARAMDPAILAGIEDVKRLNFDFDELAYTDLRDISDLAICQAFGIPPILVGTRFGLERSTFANYGEARRSFYEDTVEPLWRRIADSFTFDLLDEYSDTTAMHCAFDVSEVAAMRDDTLPEKQWALSALSAGGISTHTFAALSGLEPQGEDVFLRSLVTVEIPVNGERPEQPMPERMVALPEIRVETAPLEERRRIIGERGRTAYLKVAARFERELRRFFRLQGQRIVSVVVRTADGPPETRDDLLGIDWDEEERLLTEILQRLQLANAQLAFTLANQVTQGEIVWDLANPHVQKLIGELGHRIVGINATTRADVERVVLESLNEGVSMPELAGRLEGLFAETYQNRAVTVSRTESQVAYNRGSVTAYESTGEVDRVMMLDNEEHCGYGGDDDGLECCERNGMVVPLDEAEFHILGTHPNCVLSVAPVLVGEEV